MALKISIPEALGALTPDGRLLFLTRALRLFAYGLISIVLVLYLKEIGLSTGAIGTLLTLTLVGDVLVSLCITTRADRIGRRRMLLLGALLMLFAGALFVATRNYLLLILAATVGVLSPSGNEVGPFLSIEQASLAHTVSDTQRTRVFAWYGLAGSFATALGAGGAGLAVQRLQHYGVSLLTAYRLLVIAYAALGLLLGLLFLKLSPAIEVPAKDAEMETVFPFRTFLGLHRSLGIVMQLSALFALDAFAGGFVLQSFVVYWFHVRFGVTPGVLGSIFFGANVLAGFSALLAAEVAARIGLIRTMVFTHMPSNLLLILVPLMPSLPLAILMLLLRFSISQMDVPTRQSYTMAVVHPEERSAAAGVTGTARSVGAALSPILAGLLLQNPLSIAFSAPFFLSGGLKLLYDLLLYRRFRLLGSPEEQKGKQHESV